MLRLGDTNCTTNATGAGAGVAMPTWIDEYSTSQYNALLMSDPLPRSGGADGVLPCTLASGQIGNHNFDSDGLPSNTQDGNSVRLSP